MKKYAAPLAAALTAALGVATALPAAAATGTEPPSSAARAAATPTGLRLMPLGDSITWGVGSPSGNSYRGFLWNQLSAEGHALDFVGSGRGGTMSDPDNEGHSGWRIDQITGIADSVLARYRPNVVTLEIGTNDLNGNYQIPTAPDRLRALIDRITNDAPDATVLVGTVIISTSGTEEANRPAFNAKLPGIVQAEQAAGKHVRLVDMSALTSADLADSLHPNDNGYRKMADAFNAGVQAADAAGWIKPPASAGGQVRSGIAGKCLDVNGGNSANGTAADIATCNGSDAQQWSAHSDGTLRALGKCLDATGRGTANGTKIEIWDCNGGTNQQWQAYNGGYRNPVSGRCLDDPGASTTDGTQLVLWDCNGGANQQWTALPAS
ncbi:ricin-type beta-trefoil lectin domain protein [Streptomyces sp. NBC_01340]|uniref:ricin-type beta-trefoil lectin domain protein n=1 Tax=unclassified Streptomyces TaxID=2593676 RepID=UPI00225846FA|nr:MULTISPECIES: ricin-type beta-trefoil lectin domain protein [unclassified Streptomyces]MCX4459969.1 ricin-type beta-trefoil lectin domain protein [Streptomyces sp. NBC_01719]MCX4499327.1 ricin-type beta-trefoil lectin domain protein [Streptomyces sp. NBC_01728]MCX4594750.1 ricin-type beta-trefoil lectin domain protein [Streptomyces sp. NBC_01549]WSI36091.1 ricin-type beta-trefoil lectin domain protein [Streptomyces sp. NBC_01340]WSI43722.1 ricin-type beta-trefoil lectin domain protein [Stre